MAPNGFAAFLLPRIPFPTISPISYAQDNHGREIHCLGVFYEEYEVKLREGFAQHREDAVLQDLMIMRFPCSRKIPKSYV